MRDINEITNDVLSLSDFDVLLLFGLITKTTAFEFTLKQWDEIFEILGYTFGVLEEMPIPSQVGELREDIILLTNDDIKFIFLDVGLKRDLPYPKIPIQSPLKEPVFIFMCEGDIISTVFHPRKTCSALKTSVNNRSIVEIERSEAEEFMHVCPICVLEKDKNRD